MKIYFTIETNENIFEVKDFTKAIKEKLQEIIDDNYWLRNKKSPRVKITSTIEITT